nr:MAG TPA: hypothetical protein [Caudoviricetes sp.]
MLSPLNSYNLTVRRPPERAVFLIPKIKNRKGVLY